MDDRLPAHVWIEAEISKCQAKGLSVYYINKGSLTGGTLLLKINGLGNGFRILTQIRDLDGNLSWMDALGEGDLEEREIDRYISRSIERDPDIWAIEIEDKTLKNPFEENKGDEYE
ncbi:MAG: hypothetical protein CL565_00280 [Alphaproteobacteria bacterium]|nr:hypothetical protein [Alphaproteobacteria bacterium]|tara:strand:- start:226 stop:573 length:348 start_codon:yes stop_codon:yes gene_type:complete